MKYPALSYYILYVLTYLFALLPLWVIRLKSKLLADLLYYVLHYRRRVVRDNLTRCFPEKSEEEIGAIERRFYRGFTYQVLSSFKLLTYTPAQLCRHISLERLDVLEQLRAEGHPAILLMMGHYGNWEYFSGSQELIKGSGLQIYQIYRPLKNTAADRLMHRIRERFGSRGIPKHDVPRELLRLMRAPYPAETPLVIFIADQSPAYAGSYWTTFLGRETAFFNGTEKLSTKFSLPVVYMDVKRTGADSYIGTIELLHHPQETVPSGAVTEAYVRKMEKTILRDPALWLWSHRRWKRPRLPQ